VPIFYENEWPKANHQPSQPNGWRADGLMSEVKNLAMISTGRDSCSTSSKEVEEKCLN
jgi:hypothetical protein